MAFFFQSNICISLLNICAFYASEQCMLHVFFYRAYSYEPGWYISICALLWPHLPLLSWSQHSPLVPSLGPIIKHQPDQPANSVSNAHWDWIYHLCSTVPSPILSVVDIWESDHSNICYNQGFNSHCTWNMGELRGSVCCVAVYLVWPWGVVRRFRMPIFSCVAFLLPSFSHYSLPTWVIFRAVLFWVDGIFSLVWSVD